MHHSGASLIFSVKHLVFFLLAALGIALLLTRRSKKPARITALIGSVLLLGGLGGLVIPELGRLLGMHPSPMCTLTKLMAFGWLQGKYPPPLIAGIGVIIVLSLIGKKLFCGWACPLGALQELVFMIPGVKKLKNLPFRITNAVRTALFAIFLIGLFFFGTITYDYFNGFEMFHWKPTTHLVALFLSILGASLFYYRPYCYLICPVGLLSWVLERFALLGVRLERGLCRDCSACLKLSPCPSIHGLLEGKSSWLADCTSCGICVAKCPKRALRFGFFKPGA
ncbi:MAG: 4Fe-4S binding protein [Elusimicrobiota bacterium]